jgi:hypothetical protein
MRRKGRIHRKNNASIELGVGATLEVDSGRLAGTVARVFNVNGTKCFVVTEDKATPTGFEYGQQQYDYSTDLGGNQWTFKISYLTPDASHSLCFQEVYYSDKSKRWNLVKGDNGLTERVNGLKIGRREKCLR